MGWILTQHGLWGECFGVDEIHQEDYVDGVNFQATWFVKRLFSCEWNTRRRLCRWGEFSYMVCEEEITTDNGIKMLSTSLFSNLHTSPNVDSWFKQIVNIEKSKIYENKNAGLCKEEIWWECEICYGISSIISPFVLIPQPSHPTRQGKVACEQMLK